MISRLQAPLFKHVLEHGKSGYHVCGSSQYCLAMSELGGCSAVSVAPRV